MRNTLLLVLAAMLFGAGAFGVVLYLIGSADRQVQQLSLLLIAASSACILMMKGKLQGYRGGWHSEQNDG